MSLLKHTILICLLVGIGFVNGQVLTLYEYQQSDSKTNCTEGLKNNDVVVFKATLDHFKNAKYFFFQLKKESESEFSTHSRCDLQSVTSNKDTTKCTHHNDTIEITLSIKANQEYNNANIIGLIYISGYSYKTSDERRFPEIYDSSRSTYKLTINGNDVLKNETKCVISIKNMSRMYIMLNCIRQPSPCLLNIMPVNKTARGENNTASIEIETQLLAEDISINYGSCVVDKTITCTLDKNINEKITTQESKTNTPDLLKWIGVSFGIPLVLCAMLFLIYYYKRKQNRNQESDSYKSKNDHKGSHNQEVSQELTNPLLFTLNNSDEESANRKNAQRQKSYFEEVKGAHNLITDFKTCLKELTHKEYIKINNFKIEDLPSKYKDTKLFEVTKSIADLTVWTSTTFISSHRPEVYLKTQTPYPFSDKRGDSSTTRVGTGFIKRVRKKTGCLSRCICYKCQHSKIPAKVRGKICISTSRTVVFDKSEALRTTFRFFYDEENDTYQCLEGHRVEKTIDTFDQIEIECVTCDEELIDRLIQQSERCKISMKELNTSCHQNKFDDNLTIIVSHPHGCPKHVSIGKWVKKIIVKKEDANLYTQYTYTTPTCNGCIGSFVYVVGASDISLVHHTHIGVNEYAKVNYSSTGMEHTKEM